MNETSLEPECATNTHEQYSNLHRDSGLPNCDSDNEKNCGNVKTTVRKLLQDDHQSNSMKSKHSERKQIVTLSTGSSTQASVVRSLVERGCQISNNECLVQVMYERMISDYNNVMVF